MSHAHKGQSHVITIFLSEGKQSLLSSKQIDASHLLVLSEKPYSPSQSGQPSISDSRNCVILRLIPTRNSSNLEMIDLRMLHILGSSHSF
jgi:hypothetical protein